MFIKWQRSIYYYESVYEIQKAELLPRLLKQHEVNKCESIKNQFSLKAQNIHPILKCVNKLQWYGKFIGQVKQ